MNQTRAQLAERGSTLIIVLWIAFGLVALTLYFADTMSFESRVADNRVCSQAAEQAIEGAARYVSYILATQETNGYLPDPDTYACAAVKVGDARYWVIGRDTNDVVGPAPIAYGLIDEARRINLNGLSDNVLSNMLLYLPRMTPELTTAILDWRNTNGGSGSYQTYYSTLNPPYQNKSAPFETVDELRMLYGADLDTLVGNDINLNGVLDPNENQQDGLCEPGVLEYVTIYSREPTTYSNGMAQCVSISSVSASGPVVTLLQNYLGSSREQQILSALGVSSGGGGGARGGGGGARGGGGGARGGGGATAATSATFRSPLEFYRKSKMTADEFTQIADALTVTTNQYINGRINVNTASAEVLACLPGLNGDTDVAQTLVDYRVSNPSALTSIAWVADALSNNSSVLDALQATDSITIHSYQFTADIAAVGAFGRGYRRVRFVFDTVDGTPKIIYRKDLTHLGWALGKEVHQIIYAAKDTQ